MFVGQTIRGIVYGELKSLEDGDGNSVPPTPSYQTKYSDVDTLDHSIYFKTDNETIYVFWDNTFFPYGLLSKQLLLTGSTNDYEQKWDVSEEPKWKNKIGQRIAAFKIIWVETWTSDLDGGNKVYTTYPQTFVITTEDGQQIILSAAEFQKQEDNALYFMMDNLLVTTNPQLAKELHLL